MQLTIRTILLLLLLLSIPYVANADTHAAASCERTAVNDAVGAAVEGDTVTIPACNDGPSTAWTSSVTVSKAISIIGNGSTGSSKTKLIADSSLTSGLFVVTANTTSLVRISGIYFHLPITDNNDRFAIKMNAPTLTQFKLDNNVFYGGKYQYFQGVNSKVWGVITGNIFWNAQASMELDGNNDTSWQSLVAGTDIGLNSLYIEGNTFKRDGSLSCTGRQNHIESGNGGTFTVRYNTFDGSAYCYNECNPYNSQTCIVDDHIMTHGNGDCYVSNAIRAHPVIEVYNNKHTSNYMSHVIFRGGSILYSNNQITTVNGTPVVYLREEEAENVEGTAFAECGKDHWPAEDQVFNSFFWDNKVNNSTMTVSPYPNGSDPFFDEERDYFLHAPQATGGKETLYQTGGVYFTYHANGEMTTSLSGANAYYPYTTYQCPHPLAGLTGGCDNTKYGTAGYNTPRSLTSGTMSGGTLQ